MKRAMVMLLWLMGSWGLWGQTAARMATGAEQVEEYVRLAQGKRVAVVANQASVAGGKHLVDILLERGVEVRYILCPEHGFRGAAEAGAKVADGVDPLTGLPLISLYGDAKKPSPSVLKGVEQVVFDLQDVGCRFYTYISTLHYVMEYCAENGVELVVLDRPNPNASYVDGPVLEEKYRSFVGMHPGVPVVYGMTIGEYACMIQGEGWIACHDSLQMHVVALQNYTHDSLYHLPIAPSPNLQTDQAIALYPSLCLFEGTNVSVGRGTATPFEVIGRPSYAKHDYRFTPRPIAGVSNHPPHNGKVCYGLDLSQVEPCRCFDLSYLMEMYAHSDKQTFFLKSNFFEKLAGTAQLRRQIVAGAGEEEIRASWEPALARFRQIREKYLLYQ